VVGREKIVKISEILTENHVIPILSAGDKQAALSQIVECIGSDLNGSAQDDVQVLNALLERERLGSTGVGEGVAIPHAKITGLSDLVACLARVPGGVEFDAIDKEPVRLIFALLVPENSAGTHLKALARISRLLKNATFRSKVLEFTEQKQIYSAVVEEDAKY
jgi:PTS system nitrogen regulatory IIA component